MTDKEKLDKVLEYVARREDFFYNALCKHEAGSLAALQCAMQASSFQEVRYFLDSLNEL